MSRKSGCGDGVSDKIVCGSKKGKYEPLIEREAEHDREMAGGASNDKQVPELVGGEFAGPEGGLAGGVDDGADGVGNASGEEPEDGDQVG